jgi:hypothetical protein
MKTSHQFARELLDGPDLPIMAPVVLDYDHDVEEVVEPVISETDGITFDGKHTPILVISFNPPEGYKRPRRPLTVGHGMALFTLSQIEEIYVHGSNTLKDWKAMGKLAQDFLRADIY